MISPEHDGVVAGRRGRCDTGAVRGSNEDTAYAGERLLAVADGMGGPGGAAASTAAIDALKALELADVPAADPLTMLAGAVTDADRTVRALATVNRRRRRGIDTIWSAPVLLYPVSRTSPAREDRRDGTTNGAKVGTNACRMGGRACGSRR